MTQRRAASAERRAVQHAHRIRAAATKIDRLRMVFGSLVAEVSRRSNNHRITEVTDAVLDLVHRLQHRLPMPERAQGAPTIHQITAPRTAYRRARGAPPD